MRASGSRSVKVEMQRQDGDAVVGDLARAYCRCADVFRKVSELALDVDDKRRQVIVRLFENAP